MASLEFRLKEIDETRNFLVDEIKQNDLMNEKHKKVCTAFNYFKHFLTFTSAVSGCVSIFAFATLFVIPLGTGSSAVGLRICAITAGIKRF